MRGFRGLLRLIFLSGEEGNIGKRKMRIGNRRKQLPVESVAVRNL
ncbi:hypothetical protein IC582_022070 [Cucumis melo]